MKKREDFRYQSGEGGSERTKGEVVLIMLGGGGDTGGRKVEKRRTGPVWGVFEERFRAERDSSTGGRKKGESDRGGKENHSPKGKNGLRSRQFMTKGWGGRIGGKKEKGYGSALERARSQSCTAEMGAVDGEGGGAGV